jgi:hypothetical protein
MGSQSNYLTQYPTLNPAKTSTKSPTHFPTQSQATSNPTATPTNGPSFTPSISYANIDGVATCRLDPPVNNTKIEEIVAFDYILIQIGNSTDPSSKIKEVESDLHEILSKDILNCVYDNESSFSIFELGKGDPDILSTDGCGKFGVEEDPCWLVNAKISLRISFTADGLLNRRRLSNNEIFEHLIPILRNSLASLGAEFQGFTNLKSGGKISGKVENIETENTSIIADIRDYVKNAGMWFFLCCAGVAFLFIVTIIFTQRRRRQQKINKLINRIDNLDVPPEMKMKVEGPGHLVNDEDLEKEEKGFNVEELPHLENGDRDLPNSKLCAVAVNPVFIATDLTKKIDLKCILEKVTNTK